MTKIAISLSLLFFAASAIAESSGETMKRYSSLGYQEARAAGFDTKTIPRLPLNNVAKEFFARVEKEKQQLWKEFVLEPDNPDYADLSAQEREDIANDPYGNLEVKYLMTIDEVSEVYENGRLVGYFLKCDDSVQAAIYQDGAGTYYYMDLNQVVVAEEDWSA